MESISALGVASLFAASIKIGALGYTQQFGRRVILLHLLVIVFALQDLIIFLFEQGAASSVSSQGILTDSRLVLRCVSIFLCVVYAVSLSQLRYANPVRGLYALIGVAVIGMNSTGVNGVIAVAD
jgi:hypothetical protein